MIAASGSVSNGGGDRLVSSSIRTLPFDESPNRAVRLGGGEPWNVNAERVSLKVVSVGAMGRGGVLAMTRGRVGGDVIACCVVRARPRSSS